MNKPDIDRIQHIRLYCERVAKTIERYGRDYDTFISDNDYFDSISMKIMQIGELTGSLSDDFKERTNDRMPWGLMRGIRNLFAHAYVTMDKSVIWDVAVGDIPGLLSFCNEIIEKAERESMEGEAHGSRIERKKDGQER